MSEYRLPIRPESAEEVAQSFARVRREGVGARPVVFGSADRPQVVVMSFEAHDQMVTELRRRRAAAEAGASVLAELPGEVSAEFQADLEQAITGAISDDEFRARTVARHRRQRGSGT